MLIGGGAGLQLLALTLPPLRTALGIRAPVPIVLGGYAAGLALPWITRDTTSTGIVVRRGTAFPSRAGVPAHEEP